MTKLPVLVLLAGLVSACTAYAPPQHQSYAPTAGGSYTVRAGENIYAVAKKNNVRMTDIIALNKLTAPYHLRTGQTITLPARDGFAAPAPESAPMDYIDKGPLRPTPERVAVPYETTTAAPSQGLAGAQAVDATPLEPVVIEGKRDPAIKTTQNFGTAQPEPIKLEGQDKEDHEAAVPALPAPSTSAAPTPTAATTVPDLAAKTPSGETDLNASAPSFGWPVRGTIISAYGPKGKGRDNDGINIGAPKGSPVKAAEGGMVVYAGNEMKGFGNLVLIRHQGGWVTAYAHLDRITVTKEAIVAKGDMIGTVGSTGGVSSPQLHFETRRDGAAVDPELMIK